MVISRTPTAVLAIATAATGDELGLLLETDFALSGTHLFERRIWMIGEKVDEDFSLENKKAGSVGRISRDVLQQCSSRKDVPSVNNDG